MSVGAIAGLIAAIAFAVIAGVLIYPMVRLGRLFDAIAKTVKDAGDEVMPVIKQGNEAVGEINKTLSDVNSITDSVKYTDPEKYEPLFEEYNKTWIKYADQCGVPISAKTVEGKTETLGILDTEKPAARFVTLGAKKYAYRDLSGKLHITVAGVSKKKGAIELENAGGLDAFKEGFIFKDAGGSELVYNDNPQIKE